MGSNTYNKPHAVCIPYPAQGHINPMLKLAKLLHTHSFHVTFVLTDYNYTRLARSNGPAAVAGLPDFRFESIPDGLPPSDNDITQDIPALSKSTTVNCLAPFRRLLDELNARSPPVSVIISDGGMTFALDAASGLGIPGILLWTASACGYLAYIHYKDLVDRGLVPFKDTADFSNGYLDTKIDWVVGLIAGMSLKDFPSFLRTTSNDDIMLNYLLRETKRAAIADAIIINTFDDLEASALAAIQDILPPPIYTVGPLSSLVRRAVPDDSPLASITTSLWKEDDTCLHWLNGKAPDSVVYVNFGSITVMSNDQMVEFAWGLMNSGYEFIWVVRPDLVKGESSGLPPEFLEQTKERGLMITWCPQEEVLAHPAIGSFLTHSGWNSTLESLSGGVPMICWPFFAEQQTNLCLPYPAWPAPTANYNYTRAGHRRGPPRLPLRVHPRRPPALRRRHRAGHPLPSANLPLRTTTRPSAASSMSSNAFTPGLRHRRRRQHDLRFRCRRRNRHPGDSVVVCRCLQLPCHRSLY